jgi:hypothetical protein
MVRREKAKSAVSNGKPYPVNDQSPIEDPSLIEDPLQQILIQLI